MRMSMRTRLFMVVTGLILFFVIFSLFMNSQFLDKFYIKHKKAMLSRSKEIIEGIYKGNPDTISLELESIERNREINISILSPEYQLKYNSSFRIFNAQRMEGLNSQGRFEANFERRPFEHRMPLIYSLELKLDQLKPGENITDMVTDPRLKTNFLVLASRLGNGELLVLSTPLTAIRENAAIANRFFMLTGLITVILGGIAVFLYANRFTKPILELNLIAQRMSLLDFSQKYPVHSADEVGQLGNSINSLSDQLDKAISELKKANDKLKEDIERERRIDEMRKEFVSNVSHELKTPIALIQGYAEGLKLNVNEDEENRNFYCDVIMDEADKMNRLVKDLLNLSQIESGYFKLETSTFDLSSLIDYVLEKYRPIFTERGIKTGVDKADSISAGGDIVRVEQVLVNYLNNAIDHVDEEKSVQVTVKNHDDKVRVSVFNSGKTIPEEALDKIWTSFYKVDKARTRAYGGTGLGLSVVRAIMELHHNAFGVENKDNGVLFWFELDRIDEAKIQF